MSDINAIIDRLQQLDAQVMVAYQKLTECPERIRFSVGDLRSHLARVIPDGMTAEDKMMAIYDREFEMFTLTNVLKNGQAIFSCQAKGRKVSGTILKNDDEIELSFLDIASGAGNGKQAVFSAVTHILVGHEAKITKSSEAEIQL